MREKHEATERQRRELAKKQAKARAEAAQQAKQALLAEKTVREAKPGVTIRLFNFFGRDDEATARPSSPKLSSSAPKGVPLSFPFKRKLIVSMRTGTCCA
jgi:hypothetical protein